MITQGCYPGLLYKIWPPKLFHINDMISSFKALEFRNWRAFEFFSIIEQKYY